MKFSSMLILLSLLYTNNLYANNETSDFKCTVKSASNINEKGNIEEIELWKFYINQNFTVDRISGIITGKNLKNNFVGVKHSVYNDEYNSYSVVSVSGNDSLTNYLQINKSEKTKLKPFVYIMTNVVLTGICKYY